jgi:hypothetical protein
MNVVSVACARLGTLLNQLGQAGTRLAGVVVRDNKRAGGRSETRPASFVTGKLDHRPGEHQVVVIVRGDHELLAIDDI